MNATYCNGYGLIITPWWCLENQLSPMCLPGFPCHDCPQAVAIALNNQQPRIKLPAWLRNASKAVQRDWLREQAVRSK